MAVLQCCILITVDAKGNTQAEFLHLTRNMHILVFYREKSYIYIYFFFFTRVSMLITVETAYLYLEGKYINHNQCAERFCCMNILLYDGKIILQRFGMMSNPIVQNQI